MEKIMLKILRGVLGFVVALISFGIINQLLIVIGTVVAGLVLLTFNVLLNFNPSPDRLSAIRLESIGLIINIIISAHISIKIYKKIANKKQHLNNIEEEKKVEVL